MKSLELKQDLIYSGLTNMYLEDIQTIQSILLGKQPGSKVYLFLKELISFKRSIIRMIPNEQDSKKDAFDDVFVGYEKQEQAKKKDSERNFEFLKRTFLQMEMGQKQMVNRLLSDTQQYLLDATLLKNIHKKHREIVAFLSKEK